MCPKEQYITISPTCLALIFRVFSGMYDEKMNFTKIFREIILILYLNKKNFAFLGSVRKELSRIAYSTTKILKTQQSTERNVELQS